MANKQPGFTLIVAVVVVAVLFFSIGAGIILSWDPSSAGSLNPIVLVKPQAVDVSPKKPKLELQFVNLPYLEVGFYQLWGRSQSIWQSVVSFKMRADGRLTTLGGDLWPDNLVSSEVDLSLIKSWQLTIEPEGDLDGQPSEVVILSGQVADSSLETNLYFQAVDLSLAAAQVKFGTNDQTLEQSLAGLSLGSFRPKSISQPAALAAAEAENQGLASAQVEGLESVTFQTIDQAANLKDLPLAGGWRYHTWLELDSDQQVTRLDLGGFYQAGESDLKNDYSQSDFEFSLPGEDFWQQAPAGLVFPLELAQFEGRVLVSLEPVFAGQNLVAGKSLGLVFLEKTFAKGLLAGQVEDLNLDVSLFPKGFLKLH